MQGVAVGPRAFCNTTQGGARGGAVGGGGKTGLGTMSGCFYLFTVILVRFVRI